MAKFHTLKVKEVRRETQDAVSVSFEIPQDLESDFGYKAGQYINIRKEISGEDLRRSYSLCSSPLEEDFRVAVKEVDGGRFSTFVNRQLQAGELLEVMSPEGGFTYSPATDGKVNRYVLFAAGSGITPVMSILKTVLRKEPEARVDLYYGNRDLNNILFRSELVDLEKTHPAKLNVFHVLSRDESADCFSHGRIDENLLEDIAQNKVGFHSATAYYICGPEEMILTVSKFLSAKDIERSRIHFELFTTPTEKLAELSGPVDVDKLPPFEGTAQMTVIMDGDEFEFDLEAQGEPILDAAMEAGVDAPFSCKGAVCCTCKAQVLEGKVHMEMNYALSEEEVDQGFILTCQSHPRSERVVVDYDVI
jgi:ring-1,2-phenylacetyl-CoA epoxidase subunit PaaE